MTYAGKPAEAETQIETAMRLDPHFPPLFVFYRGLAQFEQTRIEEAAVTLKEAVQLNPDDPWPYAFLAASYGYLGREKEGVEAIAAMNTARLKAGGAPFVMRDVMTFGSPHTFRPPPESPLFRGLLRLDIPDDFHSSAFDSLRLTGREVRSLFFGHRLHGRALRDGEEYGASVAADGAAIRFGRWGAGASTAKLDRDRLCFVSSTTTSCGSVLRNPGGTRTKENEYLWFFGDWVVPFSQVE